VKARLPLEVGPDAAVLPPHPSLARALFALVERNRERLRRWLPWVEEMRTVEDEARFLEGSWRAFEAGERLPGVLTVGGRIAGMIGLSIDRANASAEVGYWVDGEVEGRGYVSRALARLCDVAFGELRLQRVVILAAVDNARSRTVAERAGFRAARLQPGALQLRGWAIDVVVYELSRSAWERRRSSKAG